MFRTTVPYLQVHRASFNVFSSLAFKRFGYLFSRFKHYEELSEKLNLYVMFYAESLLWEVASYLKWSLIIT